MIKIQYFETRKLKKQKKWEAEFDREYKKIMKEIRNEKNKKVSTKCR